MSERFTYLRERLLPELPRQRDDASVDRYRDDLGRSLAEWYRSNLRAIRELDSNPALTVARITSEQSLATNTPTVLAFNAVNVDTHSWWDVATNQYVPQEPGFYRCSWLIDFHDTAAIATSTYAWAQLDADGKAYRFVGYGNGAALDVMVSGTAVVECNGSTSALSVTGLVFDGTAPTMFHESDDIYRSWFSVDYIGRRRIA